MKTLLIGINAKYIHPNLAIRLLKANTEEECEIKEFNIKDSYEKIYKSISEYDVLAFSCYIWNIELIKKILLEAKKDNKIIILGGPEVSYNAEFYLKNNLADYVIKNEGEEAFDLLLQKINGKNIDIDSIPNLYYENKYTFDKYVDLNTKKMAYDLLDDIENQIVYIETSRGCPYKCGYCMASLDNKVRFFNIEEIKKQIKILIEKGARIFKFLDRTFNANKKNFLSLIDFIIENHREYNSFQFEITGDLLSEEIIHYINDHSPKNLFRFEIGIQSTNILANQAVGRIQNNEKLFNNIRLIQNKGVIDLHLDLIAGLPFEDYKSFEKTFNEVISLRPKELQMGFLKLLHGTRLHQEKQKYDYKYLECAPYEIIENKYMSKEDIKNIHIAEEAFEKYYNSNYYKKSINMILDNTSNPYQFFYQLGLKIKKSNPKRLEDSFKELDSFIKDDLNYEKYHTSLIYEYLSYFNIKPSNWWEEKISAKEKKEALRKLIKDNDTISFSIDELYKHSILVNLKDSYILGIYTQNKKQILIINK